MKNLGHGKRWSRISNLSVFLQIISLSFLSHPIRKIRQRGLLGFVVSFVTFQLHACFHPQIDQPALGLSREYLIKGLSDKLVQAYHSYQIDTAVIYGANRTEAEQEMKDVLEFEISLANVNFILAFNSKFLTKLLECFLWKISLPREERRNSSKLYNLKQLKELQKIFPSLDWVDYFNTFLTPADQVNEEEAVVMTDVKLFRNLCELLEITKKRCVA